MIAAERVGAIVWKEWQEYRGIWAPWLPALFTLPVMGLPFIFSELVPAWSGDALESSDYAGHIAGLRSAWPALAELPLRNAIQAWLFHQFLLVLIFVPITGAMSLSAYSLIGEKGNRSLEPLLATPLTPVEFLLGKAVAAVLPSLLIEALAVILYASAVTAVAGVAVLQAILTPASLLVVFVIAPLATLVAVQLAILGSVRAKDPRSAQQAGVLLVLPLIGLVAAQSAGALWVSALSWVVGGAGLGLLWLVLFAASTALFEPERMLTRWE